MNASVHQSSRLPHSFNGVSNGYSNRHQIFQRVDSGINRHPSIAALDVKNTSEVSASGAFANHTVGEKFRNAKIIYRISHVSPLTQDPAQSRGGGIEP